MKHSWLFAVGLMLAGCGGDSSPPPPPLPFPPALHGPLSMLATNWQFQFSKNMPATTTALDDGWYFDFPTYAHNPTTDCNGIPDPGCPTVNYLTMVVYASIAGALVLDANTVESDNPVYQYALKPDNTCVYPARVSLYFQSMSGDRWFAYGEQSMVLKAGVQQISVDLAGPLWVNASGIKGDAAPDPFAQAKAAVGRIGMVFGGGCFAGHGVNISSGASRFTATGYKVVP